MIAISKYSVSMWNDKKKNRVIDGFHNIDAKYQYKSEKT